MKKSIAFFMVMVAGVLVFTPLVSARTIPSETTTFSTYKGWEIEKTRLPDNVSCKATKVSKFIFKTSKIILLKGSSLEKYGDLSLLITLYKKPVPEKYAGPVELIIDEKPVAEGLLLDVGDWEYEERIRHYSRAEFTDLDPDIVEALRNAGKLTIHAGKNLDYEDETFKDLHLDKVMSELENCIEED
jgi:hypothetical protein